MAMNYATAAQADLFQLRRHAEDIQRLADPFPATVTLADFVRRDLNRAIAAGECSVFRRHPHKPDTWLSVYCVERPSPLQDHYVVTSMDVPVYHTWSGFGELRINWHVNAWKQLSWAMKYALRFFAGDGGRKPRANTLKALTKRGLVVAGAATPAALNLYRLHRKEVEIA